MTAMASGALSEDTSTRAEPHLQATVVDIGGSGVLIRGEPGAGKSVLALALLREAERQSIAAHLVADDLIYLERDRDGIVAQAPSHAQGRVELRYFGIVTRPFQPSTILRLVADIRVSAERMPEVDDLTVELMERRVAHCSFPPVPKIALDHQVMIVFEALSRHQEMVEHLG